MGAPNVNREPWRSAGNIGVALVKVGIALVAGYLALMLLHPSIQASTEPPMCWSVLGFGVTCNAWVAWIAAAATAVVVGCAPLVRMRRT